MHTRTYSHAGLKIPMTSDVRQFIRITQVTAQTLQAGQLGLKRFCLLKVPHQ